ncbi:hypothetical protein HYS91_00565 [Candidatus Daviesbacteria bacterium]|nr:hypothetical protein [Candidatus Daviesbacteria bacterium]
MNYLPPLGGKLSVKIGKKEELRILSARTTALEHAEDALSLLGEYGTVDDVMHQLTVQGRLPDAFKYSAIGLLLTGTYLNNWEEPFFDKPWARFAPLVHDGGRTWRSLNPHWKNVDGRTDFIERLPRVVEPEGLVIKEHEGSAVIREQENKYNLVEVNRESLKFRASVYQLLGLVCHAFFDSAPSVVNDDLRKRLATQWETYQRKIHILLEDYNISGVANIPYYEL